MRKKTCLVWMATKSAKRTKSALSPLSPFAFCLLSHSLCRFTCSKWNGMAWIYVWTDFQGYFGTTAMIYSKYIYISVLYGIMPNDLSIDAPEGLWMTEKSNSATHPSYFHWLLYACVRVIANQLFFPSSFRPSDLSAMRIIKLSNLSRKR